MSDEKTVSVLDLVKEPQHQNPTGAYRIGSVTYVESGEPVEAPQTIYRHGMAPAAKPANVDMGTDPHLGNPGQPQLPRFANGRLMNPNTNLVRPPTGDNKE